MNPMIRLPSKVDEQTYMQLGASQKTKRPCQGDVDGLEIRLTTWDV